MIGLKCPRMTYFNDRLSKICIIRAARRLDKSLFQQLAAGRWIKEKRNLLITGPCGVGKTWLACALGQRACRE